MEQQTLTSKLSAGLSKASAAVLNGVGILTNRYFLQISYVTLPTKEGEIPTLIKKEFISYDAATGKTKTVAAVKDATCLDYIIGSLIVKKLRQAINEKQVQIDLISCGDAALMAQIQNQQ